MGKGTLHVLVPFGGRITLTQGPCGEGTCSTFLEPGLSQVYLLMETSPTPFLFVKHITLLLDTSV